MKTFQEIILETADKKLFEATDVFAMMRRKLLAAQMSQVLPNDPNLQGIEADVRAQLKAMSTKDIVASYSTLKGTNPVPETNKEDETDSGDSGSD